MKTLQKKLDTADPHVVLALLLLAFRRDWLAIYDKLDADPSLVQDLLQQALADTGNLTFPMGDQVTRVPPSLAAYVQGTAAPLLTADLTPYLSSMEATQFTDSRIRDARRYLALARQAANLDPPDATLLNDALSPLDGIFTSYTSLAASVRATNRITQLRGRVITTGPLADLVREDLKVDLDYIEAQLNELRLATNVSVSSS
jgi:hypothetical protein